MSYQVRHKEFGLFQGQCFGLGFWYPMSEMPEQGICEFPTEKDAQDFVDFLCVECDAPLSREDLFIESFDKEFSDRLIVEGRTKIEKVKGERNETLN